tara:strand:+ start:700 stop:1014 length:315 start_codon:yes stop_codon:yes gene_type:complete
MGRLSKEFHEMQKKQYRFLLEQEDVQKRIKICDTILDSMLKSRGVRKKKYREELQNVHKFLSIKLSDYEKLKKKYSDLEKKYEQSQKKNAELSDRNVRLEMTKK